MDALRDVLYAERACAAHLQLITNSVVASPTRDVSNFAIARERAGKHTGHAQVLQFGVYTTQ